MAIELTAMEVVLSGVLAFLAGLFGLLGYYRLRSVPKNAHEAAGSAYLQRLEYYENQIIELKVRLDALRLEAEVVPSEPVAKSPSEGRRRGVGGASEADLADAVAHGMRGVGGASEGVAVAPQETQLRHLDLTNHILHLITNKSMTSRDIQSATGRTREHTSRQMKKLAEEGLVKRHSDTRPYTYSLTEQGKTRLAGQGGTA